MEKIEIKDGKKFWLISIETDELFGRISRESNYREHVMEEGGGKYVLLEDDRGMFDRFLKGAAGKLWLKLGRMGKDVFKAVNYTEDGFTVKLKVTGNHEDNMLFTLGCFLEDFLEAYILREWYNRNNIPGELEKCSLAVEIALRNIISVVHYRKKAVKRPIDPVF